MMVIKGAPAVRRLPGLADVEAGGMAVAWVFIEGRDAGVRDVRICAVAVGGYLRGSAPLQRRLAGTKAAGKGRHQGNEQRWGLCSLKAMAVLMPSRAGLQARGAP